MQDPARWGRCGALWAHQWGEPGKPLPPSKTHPALGARGWVARTVPVAMKTQYYFQKRLGGASKALIPLPSTFWTLPPPPERGSGTFGACRPRRVGPRAEQQLSRSGLKPR